jgi:hypothetical protein
MPSWLACLFLWIRALAENLCDADLVVGNRRFKFVNLASPYLQRGTGKICHYYKGLTNTRKLLRFFFTCSEVFPCYLLHLPNIKLILVFNTIVHFTHALHMPSRLRHTVKKYIVDYLKKNDMQFDTLSRSHHVMYGCSLENKYITEYHFEY